ncbi:MAG: biotin transport system substrate-specific component [Sulfitobacter sp.]|jgi:biotin transport system substrate-specific component
MAFAMNDKVLTEAVWQTEGTGLWAKRAVLVVLGVALLTVFAQIKLMIPPSPVPVTMGTFAVLAIGAAYGPRLGLTTIIAYLVVGMLGFDVFASSTAELNGLEYMMGGTGGYLVGYVLATVALGALARAGWDRSVVLMGVAMLIGTVMIYVPGIAYLGVLYGWDAPLLAWGLTPFLIGDAMKLVLAALVLPLAWKLVGKARG